MAGDRVVVTNAGKQGAPFMQSHSRGPFYKPLTSRCQISPEPVCVGERDLRVFPGASANSQRKETCFPPPTPHPTKLTRGPWSTEQASGMLAWLPVCSPSPPEPNYELPDPPFSYPTLSRLLPLAPPSPAPGSQSPGVPRPPELRPQPGSVTACGTDALPTWVPP